mmetsp:Transcript_23753/g.63653  ORF Transcript_23753/g.63653 Transcript_23753/m.63653 type:complete len:207 (-) Transcript_23753:46-666(-)
MEVGGVIGLDVQGDAVLLEVADAALLGRLGRGGLGALGARLLLAVLLLVLRTLNLRGLRRLAPRKLLDAEATLPVVCAQDIEHPRHLGAHRDELAAHEVLHVDPEVVAVRDRGHLHGEPHLAALELLDCGGGVLPDDAAELDDLRIEASLRVGRRGHRRKLGVHLVQRHRREARRDYRRESVGIVQERPDRALPGGDSFIDGGHSS